MYLSPFLPYHIQKGAPVGVPQHRSHPEQMDCRLLHHHHRQYLASEAMLFADGALSLALESVQGSSGREPPWGEFQV